jgi:hypothetical protein
MLDKKVVYDKQDKWPPVYWAIDEAINQKVANNIIGVTTWTKDAVFSHDFTFDINVRIECVSAKPKRRRTLEEMAEVKRLEAEERSQRLSQRLLLRLLEESIGRPHGADLQRTLQRHS